MGWILINLTVQIIPTRGVKIAVDAFAYMKAL